MDRNTMTGTDYSLSENDSDPRFQKPPDEHFETWRAALLATPPPVPVLTEVGCVTEVGDGVAVVSGLARALADE
ncbi:MAG: hypothetical protein KDI01_04400, partial [Halioglobus sp.]|nr:hypothetical protein [Halioglobus sp.]